jgi:anhydro-N-acetylmuramic acid kinase
MMRVLGLMSGTSLDGVDAAVIDTDGEQILGFGPSRTFPYTAEERGILGAAVSKALDIGPDAQFSAEVKAAEAVILNTHAHAVRELVAEGDLDLIGFHGQTILHRPEQKLTIQIGDPSALAGVLGVPVVADLRQRDLQEGGQGAPLVPIYHAALAKRLNHALPLAFLNLGGVSNLTWIGEGGALRAFDVGPGNGLIDQLVSQAGLGAYDVDGRLAAAGSVHEPIVEAMMGHPFFERAGPKSLDRYDFNLDPVRHLSVEDGAATLTAFSAQAAAAAVRFLPEPPRRWILCGGGRLNKVLVKELEARAGGCISADDLGLQGDAIEAEAIAYLAARSAMGLPITFPGTTGAPHAITGGVRFEA